MKLGFVGLGAKGRDQWRRENNETLVSFKKQAAQCFHIGGMFKKAQEKADQLKETEVQLTDGQEKRQGGDSLNNTAQPACSLPVSHKQELLELRMQALKDLERLMDLVTEQEKKYGH